MKGNVKEKTENQKEKRKTKKTKRKQKTEKKKAEKGRPNATWGCAARERHIAFRPPPGPEASCITTDFSFHPMLQGKTARPKDI